MIIYNVTSNIDASIHEKWLIWITEHIPHVLKTGCFTEAKLAKVVVNDDHGFTYSVQYRANSREDLDRYYSKHAESLRNEASKLFADKVLSFRTELEIIDEFFV